MRVIGGEWRGRPLVAPAGRATRPTSDRVREAVFDVIASLTLAGRLPAPDPAEAVARPALQSRPALRSLSRPAEAAPAGPLAGHVVADLYAGSGALGIEALSRGAACCTFVENDRGALVALRANLRVLSVPAARARIVPRDAAAALQSDLAEGRRYTVFFADPPYALYQQVEQLLKAVLPRLVPDGLAVIETARATRVRLPLQTVGEKTYGDTRVTFLAGNASRD